jgi:membrane protease YdiL (CAAX protease family)
MLNMLRKKPLLSSILVVALYGLWFVVPMFFVERKPDAHGVNSIADTLKIWSDELITALVLVAIITLLGWWRKVGFRSINYGGFKFIVPIILLILTILNLAWVTDDSGKWFMGFDSPIQIFEMLGVMLLLGFVEEGVFRGVFLYGLSSRFSPFYAVLVSALVFGSFHFVNIFVGADPIDTIYQATHAAAMGFLYGSLRLRLGAIWPLMILHGLWDMSLFILGSVNNSDPTSQSTNIISGLSITAPALIYGIFVFWTTHRNKTQEQLYPGDSKKF